MVSCESFGVIFHFVIPFGILARKIYLSIIFNNILRFGFNNVSNSRVGWDVHTIFRIPQRLVCIRISLAWTSDDILSHDVIVIILKLSNPDLSEKFHYDCFRASHERRRARWWCGGRLGPQQLVVPRGGGLPWLPPVPRLVVRRGPPLLPPRLPLAAAAAGARPPAPASSRALPPARRPSGAGGQARAVTATLVNAFHEINGLWIWFIRLVITFVYKSS